MPWRPSVPHLIGLLLAALYLALPIGAPRSASAAAATAGPAATAAGRARAAVHYVPPVDAPVVEPFRPPATRYGRGNRGVDYDTDPGQVIRAAADGTVVFAGRVGFGLHVVILHPDSLRTSYAFLARVTVARGQRVSQGDVVGIAGDRVHVGVRAGAAYLDPLELFGQRRMVRPRLVADPGVDAERPERRPRRERRATAV